jgi:hypothetical protein
VIGEGVTIDVRVSVGLATAPVGHVVRLADLALYDAKRERT